ncbi:hypothetical protein [Aquamicrobium terrae]
MHGNVLKNPAGNDIARILPPLIVPDEEIRLFGEHPHLSPRHLAASEAKETWRWGGGAQHR